MHVIRMCVNDDLQMGKNQSNRIQYQLNVLEDSRTQVQSEVRGRDRSIRIWIILKSEFFGQKLVYYSSKIYKLNIIHKFKINIIKEHFQIINKSLSNFKHKCFLISTLMYLFLTIILVNISIYIFHDSNISFISATKSFS